MPMLAGLGETVIGASHMGVFGGYHAFCLAYVDVPRFGGRLMIWTHVV